MLTIILKLDVPVLQRENSARCMDLPEPWSSRRPAGMTAMFRLLSRAKQIQDHITCMTSRILMEKQIIPPLATVPH